MIKITDKVKVLFTLFAIFLVVIVGLYILSVNADSDKAKRQKAFEAGYSYTKGVITEKHSYKGQTISINYYVDGKQYTYNGGWDTNPQNKGEGDSILVKYAIRDPKLSSIELENDF